MSLAEARESARQYRKIARTGGDPIAERRRARELAPTFQSAARAVHEQHASTWRNSKHRDQWIDSLTEYAFPVIGALPVDQVTTPDVMRVRSPIWLVKAETERRVKQRLMRERQRDVELQERVDALARAAPSIVSAIACAFRVSEGVADIVLDALQEAHQQDLLLLAAMAQRSVRHRITSFPPA